MKLSELKYDEKSRVYINPEKVIDYSDGEENEQYVLDCLRNAEDTSIFSKDLLKCIKDWPSEYHFTTYRPNIVRPFSIKKGQKVLEIGAGTGAITRYLGETGAEVIAVEGGLPRAKCIAERCRDLSNVTVVCSNVEDVEFEEKFDIITLIGVFEYTAKYSSHKNPFHDALKNYGDLLKPNGSLIIAIENKLGLKYFSGYNEDHFGQPYFGIEDRYGAKDITTFGYEEIKDMLGKSGYKSVKFLFPFPDYKIPKAIITDKGLENNKFNEADLIRLTKERHYGTRPKANLLNEYLAWKVIAENKLVKDVSNSFLIVAGRNGETELITDSVLAEFYTCARFEPYNTSTTFEGMDSENIVVKKHSLGSEEEPENITEFTHKFKRETEYVPGYNMHHLVVEALFKKRFAEYESLMVEWANFIKTNGIAANNVGDGKMRPEYFDALPRNVIIDKNEDLHLFDQEWTVKQSFDITFLLVRYLSEHRRKKGMYSGYASNFLGFVNKTLNACDLSPITGKRLNQIMKEDEEIRNKIHRPGGIASRKVLKSFIQLFLKMVKDVKSYIYYDLFAQR